jgi:hypothetical protein
MNKDCYLLLIILISTLHGEGLPTASLAVGEHAHVVPGEEGTV